MKALPFITIITPSLNRIEYISQAVESVILQDFLSYEHIIMDGGSTDGTIEYLKNYSRLKVISQPDRGLYDAINNGIELAQGDIIGILNTDDLYEPDVFSDVAKAFADNDHIMAVVGGATLFENSPNGERRSLSIYPPITIDQKWYRLTSGAPIINAWFFQISVFDQIGKFDLRYRYASDRDFLIRFGLEGLPFSTLDRNVYLYRKHAGSLTMDGKNDGEADFMLETRDMVEHYLDREKLPNGVERNFLDWHSVISFEEAITAMRRKKITSALDYAIYGWRWNNRWPFIFARQFLLTLIRQLHPRRE
jgi:glycosyltransferase involved in cell wall biosynthesis